MSTVNPGGAPSVTDGVAAVETEVTTWPLDVMMNVTSDGVSDSVGIAFAFGWRVFSTAEYVLVASPDDTIFPTGAATEVLNAYGGVVGVGVGSTKLGRTVATVADAEEKKDDTSAGDCTGSDALRSAYRPIMGGSLASMPKLEQTVEGYNVGRLACTHLYTEYTVRRKGAPSCQSIPSELGDVA